VSVQESNAYTEFVDRMWLQSRPMSAQIELTYRCNHLCSFCYNVPQRGQKEMSTDEVISALDKIAELGVLYLSLTGGEALCRPDFFEIARAARERRFALRLYSNGYLFADEALCDRVAALPPFEIEVSLHGSDAATHDRLTGIRGSFDKLIRGLENLSKRRIKVILKTPITRLNQHQLGGIRAIGDKFDYRVVWDPQIVPRDDGDTGPLQMAADPEVLRVLYARENRFSLRYGEELQPKDNERISTNCGTGRSTFTIDPYGNIYPCVSWRRKVANIRDVESLTEIWKTSPVLQYVRKVAEEVPKKLLAGSDEGAFCTFCPGVAEKETGSPMRMYEGAKNVAKLKLGMYQDLKGGCGPSADA
jgi:radical SAM protein with 4Fe4S-binding SPASM domain